MVGFLTCKSASAERSSTGYTPLDNDPTVRSDGSAMPARPAHTSTSAPIVPPTSFSHSRSVWSLLPGWISRLTGPRQHRVVEPGQFEAAARSAGQSWTPAVDCPSVQIADRLFERQERIANAKAAGHPLAVDEDPRHEKPLLFGTIGEGLGESATVIQVFDSNGAIDAITTDQRKSSRSSAKANKHTPPCLGHYIDVDAIDAATWAVFDEELGGQDVRDFYHVGHIEWYQLKRRRRVRWIKCLEQLKEALEGRHQVGGLDPDVV